MKKILFVFGTRPEAIKLAPLIKEFKRYPELFKSEVCVTAQHRFLLDQMLTFFDIDVDYDLNLMTPNQSLFELTANGLIGIQKVIDTVNPDLIIVQGDTTTAFIGALAGYYKHIKVVHVEAGLRSGNKYSPFPEEINRALIGKIADYHFAPTGNAKNNLEKEGINENVWNVGNTVIDALFLGIEKIKMDEIKYKNFFDFINLNKKIILVTGHRRENFGIAFDNICYALKELAEKYEDIEIVYPVHLNPNVQQSVNKILKNIKNVHLTDPLSYPYLIYLMSKCYLVLTDSGGIQEEAPSLGKPVLVMRDVTERTEGIIAGTSKLVGTDRIKIVIETQKLLENSAEYESMSKAINPYGDGKASDKIVRIISERLSFET